MNPLDGHGGASRRAFLRSGGAILTGTWIAAHWPAIAAAHHADPAAAAAKFEFFNSADAADVEAIVSQIMPSGATPGAREARAAYFIDRAMSTFFSAWSGDFRRGLSEFQAGFAAATEAPASFAAADSARQIEYLKTVEGGEFFGSIRTLTLLGMFTSPKYGGNFRGEGWKMMGFEDRHAFAPPFGYYDRDYAGFVPYAPGKGA